MTETAPKRSAPTDSAKLGERDFATRLADAGEEALQRIAELPGGQRALTAVNDLRTRVDDLTKKVRGIDALEARRREAGEGARGAEEGEDARATDDDAEAVRIVHAKSRISSAEARLFR